MSADQLIQQITNALFALIGAGAVVVAIRRPRRASANAALREAIGQCRAWRMAAGSDQRKSTS